MPELAQLHGLNEDGSVPETRLTDEFEVSNLVSVLVSNDEKRSKTRAMVKGLFDGNPPYKHTDLVRAGQSYRANVNWRIAESFLTIGLTSYWDVVSEAPSMATCVTEHGEPAEIEEWSRIITEEFQTFNLADPYLNYMFATSHYNMVLFGIGPVIWEDELDYRARAVPNILLPDGERSDLSEWEVAVVVTEYGVERLYSFVRSESAAEKRGWNVDNVKDVLMKAVPNKLWPNGRFNRWEWLQQKLRNNDLAYGQLCNKVQVAHVYYREFPKGQETEGKISHCIIEAETQGPRFLFRKVGRFENWRQVICPFYYDGGDGTHHSVKGLGIKAYGALESVNRLQCSLVDAAAFGTSMHLQSQTENMRETASVVEMGPYKVWPSQFNIVPNVNLGQMLEGPVMIKQDLINTVTSNLQQYRQGLSRTTGNPISATEASWRAENETTLARTQLTRYFDQLDEFWEERYRRVASPKAIAAECKRFQKRCMDRGVPREALNTMQSVRATRTVGYGSAFNRLQALNRMLQIITLLPQSGQQNLLRDFVSSSVGHSLANRYMDTDTGMFKNDNVIATLQIAAAKEGIPPAIPMNVNNEVYAAMFMKAAEDALGSLQQGANPMDVLRFVQTIGPAIYAHINELKKDPTKKGMVKEFEAKAKEIGKAVDQLTKIVEQMAQKQAEGQQKMMQAQAIAQGTDPNIAIKMAETKAKMDLQTAKTAHGMALKSRKAEQDLMITREKAMRESEAARMGMMESEVEPGEES